MAQYELSLFDYWRIIKRRKFIILFAFTAVMLSTWIFTNMQTPVYRATAVVKVEPSLIVPGVATETLGWDILTALNTEVKIIKSAVVSERTARKLNLISEDMSKEKIQGIVSSVQSKISASRVGNTNLIHILATSANAPETAELANATAEVYMEKGIEDRSRRAKQLRQFIETQLEDAQEKLKISEEKLKKYTEETGATGVGGYLALRLVDLQTKRTDLLKKYTNKHPDVIQIDQQAKTIEGQMRQLPAEELEYARVMRDLKLNEELYTLLAKRHKEAQISEADRVQSAFIVTYATRPGSPIRPKRRTNFTVGGLIGVFIGLIFSFIIEHLDTSIGTIEDVETYLQLPVLGVIPHIEPKRKRTLISQIRLVRSIVRSKLDKLNRLRSNLIVYHSVKSPFVEAYHTVRTNIKLAKEEGIPPGNSFLFTSSGVSEGKTLTCVNFALAAAQTGIKTLLIELDLRRPALHKIFGLKRIPGFTDCILGKNKWAEVLRGTTDFLLGEVALEKLLQAPGLENFNLITCGSIPSNPIDVFSSVQVDRIFDELKTQFELIIVDCSPVLLFADTLLLCKRVDKVIIIYKVGRIARGALKRAKAQLTNIKANILGVVLNDIKASEMEPRYGYYYAYRYYAEKESKVR